MSETPYIPTQGGRVPRDDKEAELQSLLDLDLIKWTSPEFADSLYAAWYDADMPFMKHYSSVGSNYKKRLAEGGSRPHYTRASRANINPYGDTLLGKLNPFYWAAELLKPTVSDTVHFKNFDDLLQELGGHAFHDRGDLDSDAKWDFLWPLMDEYYETRDTVGVSPDSSWLNDTREALYELMDTGIMDTDVDEFGNYVERMRLWNASVLEEVQIAKEYVSLLEEGDLLDLPSAALFKLKSALDWDLDMWSYHDPNLIRNEGISSKGPSERVAHYIVEPYIDDRYRLSELYDQWLHGAIDGDE